jgi:hypothetical protein
MELALSFTLLARVMVIPRYRPPQGDAQEDGSRCGERSPYGSNERAGGVEIEQHPAGRFPAAILDLDVLGGGVGVAPAALQQG